MRRDLALLVVTLAASVLAACATDPGRPAAPVAPVAPAASVASQSAASLLRLSDDGLSEMSVPASWTLAPFLSADAAIRLGERSSGQSLWVHTYRPGELNAGSLEQFAQKVSERMVRDPAQLRRGSSTPMVIGGVPAIAQELVSGVGEQTNAFLSVAIDGKAARHHVVLRGPQSGANTLRPQWLDIAATFRESAKPRPPLPMSALTFAWPERLSGKAVINSRNMNAKGEVRTMNGRFDIVVRPAGKEHLIVSTRAAEMRPTPIPRDAAQADLVKVIAEAATKEVPDYVVDRQGSFVRVDNLAQYQQRLEGVVTKLIPPQADPKVKAMVDQIVKPALSEETLSALIEQDWNNSVGDWGGGTFAHGVDYEFVDTQRIAGMGDQEFPRVTTLRLVGAAACDGGGRSSCVRLLHTVRTAGSGLDDAVARRVSQATGTTVRVRDYELVNTTETVVDPATLVTYRQNTGKVKRFHLSSDGQTRQVEETDTTESAYTYSTPPRAPKEATAAARPKKR